MNSSDEAETCNGLGVLNNPTQRKVPLIVYASRTHSQILQGVCVVSNENISKWLYFFAAMQELKRNEYSYMKAGVVASRDQLCILESLKHV